jgi:AmmeMemoRadiSam system protein B
MKKLAISIFILLVMMTVAGFGCQTVSDEDRNDTVETRHGASARTQEGIATRFVDVYDFHDTAVIDTRVIDGYPVAGIVNHHSLAMDLQARFFKSLKESRSDIETFVVISPDHFLAGDLISTHGFAYSTPAGEVNSQALDVNGVFVVKDVKVFQNEHGVGAVVPFIAREFPEAVVVPVYIRPEATRSQLEKLGEGIAELVDEETFVVVSSDMSHYLVDEEARENDKMTLGWIESNDWEKLSSVDDDYTDSKQGFAVLGSMFKSLKQEVSFQLLDYAISTDYGADPLETTSYINGFYLKSATSF